MAVRERIWNYFILMTIFTLLSLPPLSSAADTATEDSEDTSVTTESTLASEESELQVTAESTDETATVEAQSTSMSMVESAGTGSGVYSFTEAVGTIYTGAATYSVPIAVPPGRKGVQPKLSLSYNSYSGNGWVGEGWGLDLGSIKRSTKYGLDYSADEYVASGSELVARADWGNNYYGAKIEGAFSKYYYNTTTGGWVVTTTAGMKYYYGTTSASRQGNGYGTFKWCLDKVVDTNGNYMTVTYVKDGGQIYPSQIDYTGNSGLSTTKYVQFTLEDRTDATTSYKSKSLVTTAKRLQAISTYADGQLAREYVLSYKTNAINGRSRLDQVIISGNDGESTLQPLTLGWLDGGDGTFDSSINTTDINEISGGIAFGDIDGNGATDFIKYFSIQKSTEAYKRAYAFPFLSVGDGTFYALDLIELGVSEDGSVGMGDVNGDGFSDIVGTGTGGNVYIYCSDGLGSFTISDTFTGSSAADSILLSDLNGDGFSDLVMHDTASGKVYSYIADDSGNGTFEACSGIHTGTGGTGDGLVKLADFNGDGYPDLIKQSGGTVYAYLGIGDGTFKTAGVTTSSGASTPDYVNFADINGDGFTDIVKNEASGDIYTFLSKGDGSFTNQISANTSGKSSDLSVGDVNGDGLPDIVETDGSGINYTFLSNGDGTFQDYIVAGGPRGTGTAYLVDVDGDGRSDLFKNGGGCVCVSLSEGDGPADHLQTVQNELGGTITLEYTQSSGFQDNFIPFIVYPVTKIITDDNNGVVSQTDYTYSWPYFDRPAREFRGFEYVNQTNPDGTTVETWYEQYDEYIKGRPDEIRLNTPGGVLLSKKTFTYSTYPESPTDYAFVKLDQKLSETYDTSTVSIIEAYTYDDDNGYLVTSELSSSTDSGETITSTYVYENYGTWLWRLVKDTFEGSTSGKMRETYYDYDANGNVISKETWLSGGSNPVVDMGYDDYGNMTSITDAEDNTTTMIYDSATQTYAETIIYPSTNGVAHAVEMVYDDLFGSVTLSVDQNGNETEYAYDRYGRLEQMDAPDGGQVLYTYYDDASPVYVHQQVKETASSYVSSYEYYDGFGRPIQSKSFGVDDPIVSRSYYDEMGRVYRTEGPYFADSNGDALSQDYPYGEVSYDWLGRQSTIEAPNSSGGVAQATYDYDGLSATATDADGNQKTYIKDFLGRITTVQELTDDGTLETVYTYNAAGDLVEVEDAQGNITSIAYDTLGRKINMTDPDMGYWEYTYDANGNLLSQTDAKDQTITFAYDALNRVTSKAYSTSDPTVTYTYDLATNGVGLLYRMTNSDVTSTILTYDKMGRSTRVTKSISGTARTTSTTYDYSGKVKKTTYPNGYYVTNTYYSGTNLLYKVTGSDSVVYATISDYEPTGKIGRIVHGNGTNTTYTYNAESTRLTGILTKNANNSTIQNKSYTYYNSGDIQNISDAIENVTYSYTYDDLHRLTDETNTGSYGAMHIEYDTLGNIVSKTTGSDSFDISYDTYSKPHAIDGVDLNGTSYSYTNDANGNMTQGWDFTDSSDVKKRSITWNADNMPGSISYGDEETITTFLYDGQGSRARKKVTSQSASAYTYYFGDHYEIKDGVAYEYIFAGTLRIAQIDASTDTVSYFHKDHLGSSTLMTDESGAQVESTNYEPFGGMRSHTGTTTSDYKFTDQELDAENGLYNYNARLYDPIIGRFISPDTIVAEPYNPQSLNRYSYCLNNPLRYTDPTGHETTGSGTEEDPYVLDEIVVTGSSLLSFSTWEWIIFKMWMGSVYYSNGLLPSTAYPADNTSDKNDGVEPSSNAPSSTNEPPDTPQTVAGTQATAEMSDAGKPITADVQNNPLYSANLFAGPGVTIGYSVNLWEHELAGGHTMSRHVGKSIEYLLNRIRGVSSVSEASTFYSFGEATKIINTVLNENAGAIAEMMSINGNGFAKIESTFREPTGFNTRGEVYNTRVILTKPSVTKEGFLILTAYPY